ncbi:MAG: 2-amino-4-hydroxy-6-hydroxymethyldihydropteridine diphosphokinase [Flavobacterium sp.]|nr:2-amino-4-hydroxy-6-hydroxymethyldihydropteridine diphosphokinase [Flavobacterium sp.]
MHQVFLGIGGNTGNKHDNFDKVYTFIKNELGDIIKRSSVYETPPWGFQSQENFWNQVLMIETEFSPEKLLKNIAKIENWFGRERVSGKYTSREMDIDILYFDELIIETDTLVIPHPHIHKRLFVLVPLAEIAPEFVHPLLRLNSLQMFENCPDRSAIKKVEL